MTRWMALAGLSLACTGAEQGPVDFNKMDPEARAQAEAAREAAKAGPTEPEAALDYATQAAKETGRGLKKRLQSAMKAGGPVEAVTACNLQAPKVAADIAEIRGVRVGRSSLRIRNPGNAAPPVWVTTWLKEQGERAAEGVVGRREVVDAPGGDKQARVLLPLAVEPACLTCHGPADQIAPPVAERLSSLYPTDQATGYAVGDLRGALWAEYTFHPE